MIEPWYPTEAEADALSPGLKRAREILIENRTVVKVNLPALARRDLPFMKCWQARPGHVFISSDFSSLEPSITAHFSQDKYYKYATYDGIGKEPYIDSRGVLMIDDVYLMTASVMPQFRASVLDFFSTPENRARWLVDAEGCKGTKELKGPRKQAKPCCLGFNYGMGPKKFVAMSYDAGVNISLKDAKIMYKAYWDLYADLRNLTKKLENFMGKYKSIVNPFGYRLNTAPFKAYNAFIQSSASGVVDVFCLKFFSKMSDAKFVALIHDEVVYELPVDQVDMAREFTQECVASLNKDLGFTVPMRLGFVVAPTFAEIK